MDIPQIQDNWHKDIPAGIVVFLVALPLCIGIAIASGAPPIAGIISGIIGGMVVGFLSNSPIAVSGPAAGLILILSDAIVDMGSFEALLAAVLLSGLLQLVLGYLKGGIFGEYFPSAVIKGMLAAIGITLVFNQLPHALGYTTSAIGQGSIILTGDESIIGGLAASFKNIPYGAVIISLASMGVLLLWQMKWLQKTILSKIVPAELVVVAIGVGLNSWFAGDYPSLHLSEAYLVSIPNLFSDGAGLSQFLTFPDFSAFAKYNTYVIAFLIAGVASIETLLSVDASDKLDPYKRHTDKNRELKAQGVGNMLCGLLGGIPMTAVIVRSSANLNAGGRTRTSSILHGFLLLASVMLLPGFLNTIPLACLAAILIKVGYKLARVELFTSMYKAGRPRFINFMVTVVAILLTDLLVGIMIGVVVAIFYILKDNYKNRFKTIKRIAFDDKTESQRDETEIILSENMTILNKASLQKQLNMVEEDSIVILNGTLTNSIDYDTMEEIRNFIIKAEVVGISIYYVGFEEFFPRLELDAYTLKTISHLPIDWNSNRTNPIPDRPVQQAYKEK